MASSVNRSAHVSQSSPTAPTRMYWRNASSTSSRLCPPITRTVPDDVPDGASGCSVGSSAMRGDQEFGTLPALWASAAERFGDADALEDAPVRFTFRQLHGAVREAARGFIALGVQPGDRVAIWAPNTWEWVVALGGLHPAGAVLVPLNTRVTVQVAAYVLAKSGAKMLLTVTDFLGTDYVEMLDAERQHLPTLEHVIIIRGPASGDTLAWSDFVGQGQSVREEDVDARVAAVAPDDISDILFTSGTTGRPKGAICTHAQALRAYTDWADVVGLRAGDRYLS